MKLQKIDQFGFCRSPLYSATRHRDVTHKNTNRTEHLIFKILLTHKRSILYTHPLQCNITCIKNSSQIIEVVTAI